MNAHIGPQALVHDYEEEQRKMQEAMRSADENEESAELDNVEGPAEAEVEREKLVGGGRGGEEDDETAHDGRLGDEDEQNGEMKEKRWCGWGGIHALIN